MTLSASAFLQVIGINLCLRRGSPVPVRVPWEAGPHVQGTELTGKPGDPSEDTQGHVTW